ncbi:MAG: hypothetical protein JW969_14240 [Spirochaetales bacterium]|nr:hypothetical protein [Spirochaetales bacterium]
MGYYMDKIPQELDKYIIAISKDVGFPEEEVFMERIAQCWLEKKEIFENEMNKFNLTECKRLSINDPRGALVLTCTGSLVHIGPLRERKRNVIYSSLGFRVVRKEALQNTESYLINDIEIQKAIVFKIGPVKKTSPVYKLAVCDSSMDLAAQENLLNQLSKKVEDLMFEKNRVFMQ